MLTLAIPEAGMFGGVPAAPAVVHSLSVTTEHRCMEQTATQGGEVTACCRSERGVEVPSGGGTGLVQREEDRIIE